METMQLLKYEVIFHWIALSFYLFSLIFFVDYVASRREKAVKIALWLALIGLITHTIALGVRWYAVGHGPYLQKAESFSSIVWVAMAMFLFFSYKVPRLRGIGFVVLPTCLLMMVLGLVYNQWLGNFIGYALEHGRAGIETGLYSKEGIMKPPPTFHGIWFVIHITSTIVAMGAILISLSTAILYLLKRKKTETEFYRRLPSLEVIDNYSYKFIGFGFISWTIMIVTGAIWADQAWGRYWGWDTIEIWSLITWLFMGIYLHLRRFFRWHGEKSSWFLVACVIVSVFTLFVIPSLTATIHSEYLK
ncbi:MAG: cytochrome c biogenesis protein CcsA [Nitrospirae bacterium]|nr:cytochrome c biogenesis protein CcsA [Nitrospirota bacterium]